jgi:hypothetical protein
MLKDEIRKLKEEFKSLKTQTTHDIRKKELGSLKLKDQLDKIITNSLKSSKIAVSVLNPLNKNSSNAWKKQQRGEATLVDAAIRAGEEREKVLIQENELLRQSMYDAYVQLQTIVSNDVKDNPSSSISKSSFFNRSLVC